MAEAVDSPGMLRGKMGPDSGGRLDSPGVIVDNRTDLPDEQVQAAIEAHWVENAAMQFGTPSTFQLYAANQGANMLTRSPFRVPTNVIEEIKLARMVAETDDDVAAVIGHALAVAYGEGMRNQHPDEKTVNLYNRIARDANLDNRFKELHREYLISGQVNTIGLFSRKRLNFTPSGSDTPISEQISSPLIGVLPAENIRVVSNDVFGDGDLGYVPDSNMLKEWLTKFFGDSTSAAVKNRMRQEEPVLAQIFTGKAVIPQDDEDMFNSGQTVYTLNPRVVHRTCMPKGASAYPRPPLTANFALLEAKRLLNIMDYALLQGGTNYIVVARQGSDKLPAQQPEIDNLTEVVRHASRTGVLVGDHRLSIDIITPNLKELLEPTKRKLIGRKMAMALLRIPEQVTNDPGTEGAKQESESTARTITSDRRDIKRHVEGTTYEEVAKRNPSVFTKGPPSIWFPKIILSGVADFFTSVLKARDRGDIPRAYTVEMLGFDYDAAVAQREREIERGDDEIMVPGSVPFSGNGAPNAPGAPPNDGGFGRPPGSSPSNGRPGGAPPLDPAQRSHVPQPQVRRPRGEPIKAMYDPEQEMTIRVGELTAAMLDEFDHREVGRVTTIEKKAIAQTEVIQSANVCVVPVNIGYEVEELRAFRLAEGLSMVVGRRSDNALVARALCFREPHFDMASSLDTAMRWGFITGVEEQASEREALPAPEQPPGVGQVIAEALQNPEVVAGLVPALKEIFSGLAANVTVNVPEPQQLPPGDD